MYELLNRLGYEIPDNHKLLGEVKYTELRERIFDFFDNPTITPKDTLLFYFSGYCVPDGYGDIFVASSEIDPDNPLRRGIPFEQLISKSYGCSSQRLVIILNLVSPVSLFGAKGDDNEVQRG